MAALRILHSSNGWRRRWGFAAGQVSASRLEEYAKCPYFFFLKRVMDLEAWEETGRTEGMDPLDRGARHSLRFSKTSCKDFPAKTFFSLNRGNTLESPWRRSLATTLEKARPAGIPDLLWDIERDALLHNAAEWLAFEKNRAEGLIARDLTWNRLFGEFSPEERLPGVPAEGGASTPLNSAAESIVWICPADRKRARVVDYKTGTLPDSMAKAIAAAVMSGEKIQIAVYTGRPFGHAGVRKR